MPTMTFPHGKKPECFCDGNGFVLCHWCLGDGEYEVEDDDMGSVHLAACNECGGTGRIRCPAHEGWNQP